MAHKNAQGVVVLDPGDAGYVAPSAGGIGADGSFTAGASPGSYGASPTAAGANQTISNKGVSEQSQSGEFWDPSRNAYWKDSRPIPGMGTPPGPPSPLDATNPQIYNPNTQANTAGSNLGDAMNQLLNLGTNAPDQVQALQDGLIQAGFLDPTKKTYQPGTVNPGDATYNAAYNLYRTAIQTKTDFAAILQARVGSDAGKKFEAAAVELQAKKDRATAAAALLAARQNTPQTINRSTTNISDPLTAQGLLTPVLANALGHPPTAADLAQFTSALQTAQAQNPTLTTGVAQPATLGGQDKSTVTHTGFDAASAQQFTANYVNQKFGQEAGNVNEGTDFYKAALQAITTSGGR